MLRRWLLPAPPPIGVRLSSHSATGINAMIAMNQISEVNPLAAFTFGAAPSLLFVLSADQPRLSRRMRSLGVTMSVSRMPNLSLTTTTSPCAIR